jgi:selenocysteine lyase/cysteine desulfurase
VNGTREEPQIRSDETKRGDMSFNDAYREFLKKYPSYRQTESLDALRATEYRRLDEEGHVYLDYTGGSLYCASQVERHRQWLASGVFGNPHSASPASSATTEYVERARSHVLDFFHADPNEYAAIFTTNATGALKLVGESYPFAPGGRFLLTFDNHNSVNGIREFAKAKGAHVDYAPLLAPELRLDRGKLDSLLENADASCGNLFAYPAQSNFTGVKHPLELVNRAKAKGWDVLLDAAAFVPTSRLELRDLRPDFVTVSFYKMFGYPTGVGALLARRTALAKLRRPWFAGGTVNFVSVQGQAHVLSKSEAGFEDGTLNYLAIPAIEIGLRHIEAIGIQTIGERVKCLTAWTIEQLLALRHGNGRAMVRIYGPITTECRGGTVTLNVYDPEGRLLDWRKIEELAKERRISFRTGCFCNPGAGEMAEGLSEDDMQAAARAGDAMNQGNFLGLLRTRGHKSAGSVRISFGLASNFHDAWRFLDFVASFRDQSRLAVGEFTFDVDDCRMTRDGT